MSPSPTPHSLNISNSISIGLRLNKAFQTVTTIRNRYRRRRPSIYEEISAHGTMGHASYEEGIAKDPESHWT